MTSAPASDAAASLARLVRDEGRVVLASLVRHVGDLGLAEDAVAQLDGPGPALHLVDAIEGLDHYPLRHGARAELLTRLGRLDEAMAALRAGLALPVSEPVRRHLAGRLAAITAGS